MNKVYLVVASDYEGSYTYKAFNNKNEADKCAEFKNKYKTTWEQYEDFIVREIDLLSKCNEEIKEEDLCVRINFYAGLHKNDIVVLDEVEYHQCIKEDWCKNDFNNLSTCISVTLYVSLTKEEYDNFDKTIKCEKLVTEIQNYVFQLIDNNIDEEEITNLLFEKYGK